MRCAPTRSADILASTGVVAQPAQPARCGLHRGRLGWLFSLPCSQYAIIGTNTQPPSCNNCGSYPAPAPDWSGTVQPMIICTSLHQYRWRCCLLTGPIDCRRSICPDILEAHYGIANIFVVLYIATEQQKFPESGCTCGIRPRAWLSSAGSPAGPGSVASMFMAQCHPPRASSLVATRKLIPFRDRAPRPALE